MWATRVAALPRSPDAVLAMKLTPCCMGLCRSMYMRLAEERARDYVELEKVRSIITFVRVGAPRAPLPSARLTCNAQLSRSLDTPPASPLASAGFAQWRRRL